VQALKQRLVAGEIGRIRRIVVHAAWPRGRGYYTRNDWAGRARIGEEWVLDSPVNNAMSHFLLLMLFLAGDAPAAVAEPVRLRAELYRAQAIEMFDTAVLRMETARGTSLDFYGTHSSREIARPSLRIIGEEGEAHWVQDGYASLTTRRGSWRQAAGPESLTRECMLGDVLARFRGEQAFSCDARMAMAHVCCVEALRLGVPILPVPQAALDARSENGDVFTFIRHFDGPFQDAAHRGLGLREAGLEWASGPFETDMGAVAIRDATSA
jgi:predicted dehydrogenase